MVKGYYDECCCRCGSPVAGLVLFFIVTIGGCFTSFATLDFITGPLNIIILIGLIIATCNRKKVGARLAIFIMSLIITLLYAIGLVVSYYMVEEGAYFERELFALFVFSFGSFLIVRVYITILCYWYYKAKAEKIKAKLEGK